MAKRPPPFYGWIIIGIAILSGTLIYGVRHSFSVFFPQILDEFGWSRGSTALMLSLNVLVYGLVSPIAGSLGDRWKPKRVMTIGIIIISLATAGCAFARQLWHFYLLYGVLTPIGTAFSGAPLLTPAVANWFTKRRGLAVGLGQVGGGLSWSYTMFTEFVISRLGWQNAYFVLAGALAVLILPLYTRFHYRPEDKGLTADGTIEITANKVSASEAATKTSPAFRDWTLREAMRTRQLWLLVFSNFLYWGIGNYLVLGHQVKFTEDVGYGSAFSASVLALFGVFMVVGQFSSSISDRIGKEKTVTLAATLSIGALVALLSIKDTSQSGLLYLYAICFGLGAGLFTPSPFVAMADFFHGRNFGAISGLLLTGMGMGAAFGPWLGGYLYDTTGSYTIAFILSLACFAISCIAFWLAAPRNATKVRARI